MTIVESSDPAIPKFANESDKSTPNVGVDCQRGIGNVSTALLVDVLIKNANNIDPIRNLVFISFGSP